MKFISRANIFVKTLTIKFRFLVLHIFSFRVATATTTSPPPPSLLLFCAAAAAAAACAACAFTCAVAVRAITAAACTAACVACAAGCLCCYLCCCFAFVVLLAARRLSLSPLAARPLSLTRYFVDVALLYESPRRKPG